MKITLILFYLLLLVAPTQLGRHFFFDFSLISGIRSDYLAPTVFLTDVIIIIILAAEMIDRVKGKGLRVKYIKLSVFQKYFLLTTSYLLLSSLFVAANKWVAVYRLAKLIELILLGFVIVRLRPKIVAIINFLSIAVVYSSIIALWQFSWQKSIGGIFWWLGERSFNASTPGIANFTVFGRLILRPYGTFPHPNLLGGFLAITLPLILIRLIQENSRKLKIWYMVSLVLGTLTIFFTFSRAAWIVAFIGLFLASLNSGKVLVSWFQKNEKIPLFIFYLILITSVVLPLVLVKFVKIAEPSLQERANLVRASLSIASTNIFFGVGLNNFIIHLRSYIAPSSQAYIFQPVHNIYLLVLSEAGLIGFTLFIFSLIQIFRRSLSNPIITLVIVQLYILGVFDHYLITLQQGQLLFTLFVSLALIPRRV